jgi:hypothetical protein
MDRCRVLPPILHLYLTITILTSEAKHNQRSMPCERAQSTPSRQRTANAPVNTLVNSPPTSTRSRQRTTNAPSTHHADINLTARPLTKTSKKIKVQLELYIPKFVTSSGKIPACCLCLCLSLCRLPLSFALVLAVCASVDPPGVVTGSCYLWEMPYTNLIECTTCCMPLGARSRQQEVCQSYA